jgi:aldehyde dehydrogenase (NAD+)
MAWGGQWCTSPGYAYVHELIELFGKHPKSNPDYSQIISAREVNRLTDLIDPA